MDDRFSSSMVESELTLNRSCPVLGTNLQDDLEFLRAKNVNLETELQKADSEIENLLAENNSLKKQIEDYKKKVQNLTKICKSTEKSSPDSSRLKKRHNRTQLDFTRSLPTTPKPEIYTPNPDFKVCDVIRQPQTQVMPGHADAVAELNCSHCVIPPASTSSSNTEGATYTIPVQQSMESECDRRDSSPSESPSTRAPDPKKKIFIFGGDQCVGLSRFLIESRYQTCYENAPL